MLIMALRLGAPKTATALRNGCSKSPLTLRFSITFFRGYTHVIDGLKYAESHELVKHEGQATTIGITHHAQDHLEEVVLEVREPISKGSNLGEVVRVDVPKVGVPVPKGSNFGVASVDHPAYLVTASNTYVPTPKELFDDVVGELGKQYCKDKERIKDATMKGHDSSNIKTRHSGGRYFDKVCMSCEGIDIFLLHLRF
eukprot:Gb_01117 [translate_table: standard]